MSVVIPEGDDAPDVTDTGDTIVVADTGDDETARTVGRLEAENEQLRRDMEELRAAQAVTEVVADTALDVAIEAEQTAEVAEEVALIPDPEPEPPAEEEEHDDPPTKLHPFHRPGRELFGKH